MAMVIGMGVLVLTQESWQRHFGHALLMTLLMAACVVWGLRQWQNRPRYQSLRTSSIVVVPALMGLITLFFFNLHQYQRPAGSDVSAAVSPADILMFNLVVVLAYAALVGIFAWKRKALARDPRGFSDSGNTGPKKSINRPCCHNKLRMDWKKSLQLGGAGRQSQKIPHWS